MIDAILAAVLLHAGHVGGAREELLAWLLPVFLIGLFFLAVRPGRSEGGRAAATDEPDHVGDEPV